jgi:plastocyanin
MAGFVFPLLLLTAGLPLAAGSVSGKVDLRDSKDSTVSKKMDFSGVVVWLDPASGGPLSWPAPVTEDPRARMVQKSKAFTPHVLPVRVGTTVDFPNFDPIFHNAFSNYDGKVFDVGLYPPGTSRSVNFQRPGIVRVFCNIHAAMSAVIVVLNTPYFAETSKAGHFELPGIPAGEYWLRIFHERATQATLDAAARRVVVTAEPLVLPAIAVSESGYLAIPHKNKFGHDYTGDPDDSAYPAVHK